MQHLSRTERARSPPKKRQGRKLKFWRERNVGHSDTRTEVCSIHCIQSRSSSIQTLFWTCLYGSVPVGRAAWVRGNNHTFQVPTVLSVLALSDQSTTISPCSLLTTPSEFHAVHHLSLPPNCLLYAHASSQIIAVVFHFGRHLGSPSSPRHY